MPPIRQVAGGVRLAIRVQPRSSRNEIAGSYGDALKVRLTAPPVDGEANAALVEFLSKTFEIPRHAITILSGANSRSKVVELRGITEDRVRRLMQT